MFEYLRLCLFDRHAPTLGKVEWDGAYYVSQCRWCDKPVRRRSRKRWKEIRGVSPPSSG